MDTKIDEIKKKLTLDELKEKIKILSELAADAGKTYNMYEDENYIYSSEDEDYIYSSENKIEKEKK